MRTPEDSLRAALFVSLFAACDSGAVVERSEAQAPAQPVPEPALQGDAPTPPTSASAPRRGTLIGGEPVERIPEWPAADDPGTLRAAELRPETLRAVEASSVPVLLPTEAPWSDELRLIPLGESGYSLRARSARSKLILQASGIARLYEDLPGERGSSTIRGVSGHLTENEGILSASWIERGTSYTADLECGDPEAPECSAEGFARLLDTLAFAPSPAKNDAAHDQGAGQ